MADGFRIGDYVVLAKRITVKYGKNNDERKDVAEGTKAPIKGFVPPDGLILEFDMVNPKGKHVPVEWNVAKSKVKLPSAVETEVPSASAQVAKKLPFLTNDPALESTVVFDSWPQNQMCTDEFAPTHCMKTNVTWALECLVKSLPKYTVSDFAIVKKGGVIEIWTMKDFKAGAIKFAPQSFEIKPRHWTAGRSAIVKNTEHGSDRRPMVLDGRVRAAPGDDSKSKFALFWVVQRASASEKAEMKLVNMELVYTKLTVDASFQIGDETVEVKKDGADKSPCIPILVNPKAIKKHTRLLAKEDADLKKLTEQDAIQKFSGKDAKKDVEADEPPAKKAKSK